MDNGLPGVHAYMHTHVHTMCKNNGFCCYVQWHKYNRIWGNSTLQATLSQSCEVSQNSKCIMMSQECVHVYSWRQPLQQERTGTTPYQGPRILINVKGKDRCSAFCTNLQISLHLLHLITHNHPPYKPACKQLCPLQHNEVYNIWIRNY